MEHNKKKYYLDIIMFIAFLVVAVSSIVLFFIIPWGSGKENFIFSRQVWSNLHDWSGLFFIFIVLVHLIFNWGWIKDMTKNIFRGEYDE